MSFLAAPALSAGQIDSFITDGFVRLDQAFDQSMADEARAILWRDMGCDENDRSTWSRPVIRLGMYSASPFIRAVSTSRIESALDQLVGRDRWLPCTSVGTFPVRFPSAVDSGDTGWHIDPGFDFQQPDFMQWRTNVFSRGRALLMLLLFSDVAEDDAPTRIRVGSHCDVARALALAGEPGLTLSQLADTGIAESARRTEVLALGAAGTAYLCHPFLVHAAQAHRGIAPRFLAQPPLMLRPGLFMRIRGAGLSPVEQAIREGIGAKR